jgi:hypothetical protein
MAQRVEETMVDKRLIAAGVAVLVLALAAGGVYWWRQRGAASAVVATPPPPVVTAPLPAPAPAPAPSEPVIRHPIAGADAASAPSPTLDRAALVDLLGSKAANAFIQFDGFVPRIVATVDNLARPHAAPRLWPVHPAAGRFTIERSGETEQIATANAARYTPFVLFAEGIDSRRAVALYRRHYALFQQAWGDLGYPRSYFNDRLVEVIDHLLATPAPAAPVKVRLTEVKGPEPITQPWLRYEYVDPTLEGLSSGQKMLIRMGPENARRLKAKLMELRRLVASGGK